MYLEHHISYMPTGFVTCVVMRQFDIGFPELTECYICLKVIRVGVAPFKIVITGVFISNLFAPINNLTFASVPAFGTLPVVTIIAIVTIF